MGKRLAAIALALTLFVSMAGCAGSITSWLVNLRNSQGDSALVNKNLAEAEKEYQLALALAPKDKHARAGLATVLYQKALANYTESKLDYAEAEVHDALRYAPDDANAQALASDIEQAKIRRDIVIANYPAYESVGASISASLKTITTSNKDIQKQVAAFGYDYDPARLTRAIADAYALQDEIARITQRLISYRALVQAGVPRAQAPTTSEAPNLLPIP